MSGFPARVAGDDALAAVFQLDMGLEEQARRSAPGAFLEIPGIRGGLVIQAIAKDHAKHILARVQQGGYIIGYIQRAPVEACKSRRKHRVPHFRAVEIQLVVAQPAKGHPRLSNGRESHRFSEERRRAGFGAGSRGMRDPLRMPILRLEQTGLEPGRLAPLALHAVLIPGHHLPEIAPAGCQALPGITDLHGLGGFDAPRIPHVPGPLLEKRKRAGNQHAVGGLRLGAAGRFELPGKERRQGIDAQRIGLIVTS